MNPLDLHTIAAIREAALAVDPNDEDLLLDMLDGSTDAGEMMDELLRVEADALDMVAANKERIKQLQERNARLSARSDAARAGMIKLLGACGLRKMERPEATVSLRAVPPKVEGEDLDPLPAECLKVTYSADKTAIKKALESGQQIDGWRLTNGGETISIRRS